MSMSAHPGDLLSAYLDGELTAREADGVRAHLETCPECQIGRASCRERV